MSGAASQQTRPTQLVPGVSPGVLRQAAGTFPTGVAVLTAGPPADVLAKTVSSFVCLSLRPPLVGVALSSRSPLAVRVTETEAFTISVLGAGQEATSRYFAAGPGEREHWPWPVPRLTWSSNGPPTVAGAVGTFACALHGVLPAGDHVLVVGHVVAATGHGGSPLVHAAGRYTSLADGEAGLGSPAVSLPSTGAA